MKRFLLLFSILLNVVFAGYSLKIIRYVSENGTGNGMTEETPCSNLEEVLQLSTQVEELIIVLSPGTYNLTLPHNYYDRKEYKNIMIFGGWENGKSNPEHKSIITGDLCIRGGHLDCIDFRAKKPIYTRNSLDGHLTITDVSLSNVAVSELEAHIDLNKSLLFYNVLCKGGTIKGNFTTGAKPVIRMDNCKFSSSAGAGLVASYVNFMASDCSFDHNEKGGLELDGCTGSLFVNCRFTDNSGKGAILLRDITDNISAQFNRCVIANNSTSDKNRSPGISAGAPIILSNSLVAGNHSEVSGDPVAPCRGAIELGRSQSQFSNNTFYGNDAALFYTMYPDDQRNVSPYQFVNCLFLKNKTGWVSVNGVNPQLNTCATDFGTGIPELDAETGRIVISADDAGVEIENNEHIILKKGSPLINRGVESTFNDLNNLSRMILGGSDIGCVEYFGEWHKRQNSQHITIGDRKYIPAEAQYDGKTYYSLISSDAYDEATTSFNMTGNMIYLGNNIAPMKQLDDRHVIAYMTYDNSKTAMLIVSTGDMDGSWAVSDKMSYTSILPTAVKQGETWWLKAGVAKTYQRSTAKNSQVRRSGTRKR